MLEVIQRLSKNNELENILKENNISKQEVYYDINESEKGILTSVVTKYEVKRFIKEYLNELFSLMNVQADISYDYINEALVVYIEADNNALIIGHDGQTMKALEHMVRQTLREYGHFNIKLNIDVAGYKERKEDNLRKEIRKIASEVLNSKVSVKLDPMNSYERRIVHSIISDYGKLVSHSDGEEPERFVRIMYKED